MDHSEIGESYAEVEEEDVDPNLYLKWITIACVFVYVSQRLWLVFLLLIPLSLGLLKRIAIHMKFNQFMANQRERINAESLCGLMVPGYLRHFASVLFKLDKHIILLLRSSMDVVGSIAAIGLLALGILCISGFVTIQLYYESVNLMKMGTQLANQTFSSQGQLQQWLHTTLKVQNISQLTEYAMDHAHTTGKNYLSNKIKDLVGNDDEKAVQLEDHIVSTFDVLYTKVMATDSANTVETNLSDAWTDLWGLITFSNTEMFETVGKIVEENIHTWWSIGESVLGILWNSSELILGAFSIIFESGTAVFDFLMDMIVFLTFLFTLLCGSETEFMPMEFIRKNLPSTKGKGANMVAQVETAVSGVFLATLKMATFYGLLAWLTHTVFAVQLIFVPSVLSAIFAAVPFFGTYFAAVPGVLELWLIRKEPFQAVLLFLIHFIPGYVVDDVIYSEIKSTNPFLTGMAIAGGMLWWGLEGAIFGPIILCVFIVMGQLYQMVLAEQNNPPQETLENRPHLVRQDAAEAPTPPKLEDTKNEKMKRFSRYSYQLDYPPWQAVNPINRRWSYIHRE